MPRAAAAANNPEREHRILDAAADLITRYGYDKTTVAEVAKGAGISKGAIYLHFASKDALVAQLLRREAGRYTRRWLATLEADPRGGTLGGMYRASLVALEGSAVMAALLRGDGQVLGSYLRRPEVVAEQRAHLRGRVQFVRQMQAARVVRDDADPEVVAHLMNLIALGLTGLDPRLADLAPPIGALFDGIATMMDRAFTPPDADPEAGKAVVRGIVEAAR